MDFYISQLKKPCIFAANHDTFYDGPALLAYLKYRKGLNLSFVTKDEIVENNFVWRFFINKFPHVVIKKENPKAMIAESACLLNKGFNIMIFPEGTTKGKQNGRLLRGKTGIIRIALISSSPVIPVGIEYYGKRRPLKLVKKINFGEPFPVKKFNSYEELRSQTDCLMEKIAELSKTVYKRSQID